MRFMIRKSSIALILANLVPLGGVLLLGWQVFDVVMIYWAENIIIGLINVMRMAACEGGILQLKAGEQTIPSLTNTQAATLSSFSKGLKFFLIPFFIFHYGMFCFAHLMAITGILGKDRDLAQSSTLEVAQSWDNAFWLAVFAIFVSHLISFFVNFMGQNEYQRTDLRQLMTRPYGRIVVLHIAVILGAGLTMALGSPVYMLAVLIALKVGIDLRMHNAERDKFSIA
jgi:hypothetical protein